MKDKQNEQLPFDAIPPAGEKPAKKAGARKGNIITRDHTHAALLTLVTLAIGLGIYVAIDSVVGVYKTTGKFRSIIEQELIGPCVEKYVKLKIDKVAASDLCWLNYKIGAEERVSGKEIMRASIVESNGRHYDADGRVLVSKTLDSGRMQIHLPSHSARWPCLADLECGTRAGATLIRENYERFNGDKKLARTAYNRGHHAVLRALRDGENPDPKGYSQKYEVIHF